MQKKNIFFRLFEKFENCFMTNHSCICCYKEIPDETIFMLCEKCSSQTEFLDENLCEKCGDKLNLNEKCVNECSKYNYAFDLNISHCYYTNSAARIIKNLKYGKRKYLARYVANILEPSFLKLGEVDIITFVPSSKSRKKERGFNQAEEIAKALGEKFDKVVLKLLVKTKDTIHQAGGTQKERLENLKDSFEFDANFCEEIKGKNILIIDDVFTTGSTLNECSKVLKKFKPKKIKTLTFAKTKFNLTANN